MRRLGQDIENLLIQLIEKYNSNERYVLTESDLVNRFYHMILTSDILSKHDLILHSELRPFDGVHVIHDQKWEKVNQINYAAKFDLALLDPHNKFWKEAFEKVLEGQTRHGKRKGIQYWRFLSYPLSAYKAVFEFKIRAKGNTTRIKEDIKKLDLLHERNLDCLTYLILLDRKAPKITIERVKKELEKHKHIRFFTQA